MTQDFGGRVAALRRRRGMTQQQLAEAVPLSYSYISLIEAGKRRPRKKIVTLLAERLDCTVEYLETGRGATEVRALELELRFAELALRSGDAASAQERFEAALAQAREQGAPYEAEALRALWGIGRCDLAIGRIGASLKACEEVARAKQLPEGITRSVVLLAVCRCYLECGDISRAVDVGEAALAEAHDAGSFHPDELAELQSTVALAYYERGDLSRAQLLLDDVLRLAERTGSLRARGAGHWNAALVAEARGDLEAAVRMTDIALAAYGEAGRLIATAELHANAAGLALRSGAMDLSLVEEHLREALRRLSDVFAPMTITADTEADLARCRLLRGDAKDAAGIATAALAKLGNQAPLQAAPIQAVLVEALLASGDTDRALNECSRLARTIDALGRPQRVKTAAVSLAEALHRSGHIEEAIAMYRQLVQPYTPWQSSSAHASIRYADEAAGARTT